MNPNHPQPQHLTAGKAKNMWDEEDADELLAVLGYKVKSSDMVDVAHKIEHLEGVLQNDDGLSQLASDSVHYNPSDLSSWLESMISELNNNISSTPVTEPPPRPPSAAFVDDLQAIAGNAIYPPPAKKAKSSPSSAGASASSSSYNPNPNPNPNPVVIVDAQENGIRLVHTLMACAEAVQQENFSLAVRYRSKTFNRPPSQFDFLVPGENMTEVDGRN